MTHHSSEVIDWLGFLDVACTFELNDLVIAVGDYLINQQKEWIQRNVFTVRKYALSSNLLSRLLDYCNQIMVSTPEIIFKSDDLKSVPKETLITLLKHDELNMEEIDIWTSVVQWAVMQIPGLVNEPRDWSFDDVVKVRAVISDVIPHIRFFNISSKDFNKKIVTYDELLTKPLRHDILHYHMENNYKPTIPMLPPRKGQAAIKFNIDSVIINEQQAAWIS